MSEQGPAGGRETEFLRKVTASLQPPISTGVLKVETSRYDANVFGNAFVILRGKHVLVRFVSDRGAELVELTCLNRPERWQPIERVLEAVGVPAPGEDDAIGLDAAANLLIRHLDTIEMKMCTSETAVKLSELEGAATRRVLEHLERFKPGGG